MCDTRIGAGASVDLNDALLVIRGVRTRVGISGIYELVHQHVELYIVRA